MLYLIKSELKYNRFMLLIFMSLAPLVFLLEVSIENMPRFFLYLVLFLLQFYYILFFSKEKRQIRFAILPVKNKTLGFFRLIYLIVLNLFIIGFYLSIGLIYKSLPNLTYSRHLVSILIYLSIDMIIFSLFYIFRDKIYEVLRSNRFFTIDKETGRNIIIFVALILNVLGVYVNIAKPHLFISIIEFIFESRPDAGDAIIFMAVSICFIYIAGRTYSSRKSFLDI